MKIAIDTQTTLGQKSGFGYYVENLVESLKKVDKKNKYELIAPQQTTDFSMPQRFVWDQFRFPQIASKKKVDVLFQPCFSAPIFYRGKVVVTIHDLIARYFPQNIPLFSRQYYSRWMPFTYFKANKIITPSQNTKKDIISLLKIPENKIQVIPSGVNKEFQPIEDKGKLALIKSRFRTGEKFILDVCTLEPRKNLMFLVKTFNIAIKKGNLPHNLVLTGKRGWYYDGLFGLVKELDLEDRVIFAGYVPESDLPALYSAADLFVFPSLYEGFGFPPLEAMACGTPVICSDTSSIPEAIGNSGILIPPKDEKTWADKIIYLITNEKLKNHYRKAGLIQSKKFNWEQTALETLKVFEEVANG